MSTLNTTDLLADANTHRLVLQATLGPVTGDLFQPAGFPDIGHVIYDAPRPNGSKEKVCVVDSAASMANHLEAVSLASAQTLELHPDLSGMPYLECVTDARNTTGGATPTRLAGATFFVGRLLDRLLFPKPTAACPQCGCDWNLESENDAQRLLAWHCCPGCVLKMSDEIHGHEQPGQLTRTNSRLLS